MEEILPGVYHWITFHEGIGEEVHSYCVTATDPVILIDPRVPDEGLDWFEQNARPVHAYLTNRHHYRHGGTFEKAFGCTVWCHEAGLHEFTHGERVKPYSHGDTLPGGVSALEVGVLCPEETALHIPRDAGILAIGDAVVRYGEDLGFVPDELMGEHPEQVKKGLRKRFADLLETDFDHLLFAHGSPWIGGAKEGLRAFLGVAKT